MLSRLSPAVYKCIIPVKHKFTLPAAIYHSLFRKQGASPFPAWPEIDDANQPCCLPTLRRAVYFLERGTRRAPEEAIARAEKYVLSQDSIEPEIREKTLTYLKYQKIRWGSLDLSDISGQPPIILEHDIIRWNDNALDDERVFETFIQALIYGNRGNFYGDIDAFAYAHEYGHAVAKMFYGAKILDTLAINVQQILLVLCLEDITHEQIEQLWIKFWQINKHMSNLVRRFEPVEEIFATYIGIRFLPIEVRQGVKSRLDKELKERNWAKAYEDFSEACDRSGRPFTPAFFLLEPVYRILEQLELDGAKLLEKFLTMQDFIWAFYTNAWGEERIITQEGTLFWDLPEDELKNIARVFVSVFKTMRDTVVPDFRRLIEAEEKNDFEALRYLRRPSDPQMTLIGHPADKYISHMILANSQDHMYSINTDVDVCVKALTNPEIRLFFESLRQQLSQGCGFVCPLAYCKQRCWFKEELRRLYQRLPKEYKEHFKEPNCCSVK